MSCRLFVFNGLCLVSYVIWLELHTLASTISLNFVSFAFFTGEAAKIYIQYSNENGSAFAVEKCDKSDNGNHNPLMSGGGSLKIYSENGKSETDMTSFKQGTVDFVLLFHNFVRCGHKLQDTTLLCFCNILFISRPLGDWLRPDIRCPCLFYSFTLLQKLMTHPIVCHCQCNEQN